MSRSRLNAGRKTKEGAVMDSGCGDEGLTYKSDRDKEKGTDLGNTLGNKTGIARTLKTYRE